MKKIHIILLGIFVAAMSPKATIAMDAKIEMPESEISNDRGSISAPSSHPTPSLGVLDAMRSKTTDDVISQQSTQTNIVPAHLDYLDLATPMKKNTSPITVSDIDINNSQVNDNSSAALDEEGYAQVPPVQKPQAVLDIINKNQSTEETDKALSNLITNSNDLEILKYLCTYDDPSIANMALHKSTIVEITNDTTTTYDQKIEILERTTTSSADQQSAKLYDNAIKQLKEQQEILTSLDKRIKPQNITSPTVLSIIKNATSMDKVNQELTNLIMTTNDAKIATDILKLSSALNSIFPFDKNLKELNSLAYNRIENVKMIMNSTRPEYQTFDQKITALQEILSEKKQDLNKFSYENPSQNFKDNLIKLYTDAIEKLTEQKTAQAQEIQAAQNKATADKETAAQQAQDIQNAQDKATAETDLPKASPEATLTPIELLRLNIKDLQQQRTDALKNQDIATLISTTFTILYKQSSLAKESIKSAFASILAQTKTNVPDAQLDSMAQTTTENIPPVNASEQQKASWITSITKMLSDVIFGKKITTNSKTQSNLAEQKREYVRTLVSKNPDIKIDWATVGLALTGKNQQTQNSDGSTTYTNMRGGVEYTVTLDPNEKIINFSPDIIKNQMEA